MDAVDILLLIAAVLLIAGGVLFLVFRKKRRPTISASDLYYTRYNSHLIYGDGSGLPVKIHTTVSSLEQKRMYGEDVNLVGFETKSGDTVSFGIRGNSNFGLFSLGDSGTLEYRGHTFVSFTLDGESEPLLADEKYARVTEESEKKDGELP